MILRFGRYRGWDLEDIPSSYLRWLAENCKNDFVATEADKEWKWRERFDKHISDDEV